MLNFKEHLVMKKKLMDHLTHCRLHCGLAGTHLFAAWATSKPEVYVPIAAIYAISAWRDAQH